MGLSIHLLGQPRMELAGTPIEDPRGHKAWGLLAYLLRSRVAPSRERVASLLFPEADDPLGALRWTLSALRRRLGEEAELGGDPLRLTLPPGTFVDVDVLSRGSWIGGDRAARTRPRVAGRADLSLQPRLRDVARERAPSRRGDDERGAPSVCARAARPRRGRRRSCITQRSSSDSTPTRRTPMSCSSAACASLAIPRPRRVTSRHAPSSSDASWASSRLLLFARRLPPPRWRLWLVSRGEPQCGRRSRPARRRSPPARSKPVSTVCAAPSRPLEASTTASSSRGRWSRSGARSSTLHAARTRKAPPRCTKERRSRSRSDGSTSPPRDGARSAGSSSCVRTTNERRSR